MGGVEESGQTAPSTNLEAAIITLPQLGLRRVMIPDPPVACKEKAQLEETGRQKRA